MKIYPLYYSLIQANLKILLESDNAALIILSKCGLGKTTFVFNAVKERKLQLSKHWLYYNSYFTPLAFYQTLGQTSALQIPRLLVLDDVELILRNKQTLNLLKSATWENEKGKRIVNYVSNSYLVKELPAINFNGKIILLLNELPPDNPILQALKDRVLFVELNFTNQQILELMKEEILPQEFKGLEFIKKKKVFDFIAKQTTPDTNLSFRTLIKAFNFYLYSPTAWQEMVWEMLKVRKENVTIKSDVVNNNKLTFNNNSL